MSTKNLVTTLNGNFKNIKMSKMLTIHSQKEIYNYFILPSSKFSWIWTILSIIFMIYIFLSVPFVISFNKISSFIIIIDLLQCLFFTIDIYLNIKYFSIEINGILIKDWKEFSSIYFDSKFKWDFLSTIPIGIIIYGITKHNQISTFLRLLYFLKFQKFTHLIQKFIGIIEFIVDYRFSSNFIRMIKTIIVVWYFGHLASCILCYIGNQELYHENSWLEENSIEHLTSFQIYLRGYLWAMYTIITVGYGSIQLITNKERLVAVFIMLFGAILCDAGVIAVLSSLINQSDTQSSNTRRNREAIILFCKSNQFIESLTDKIISYYEYLSNELNDNNECEDWKYLPKPLMLEFIQMKSFDVLCSLYLLDIDSSEHKLGFVYSIIRTITPTLAIPGQILLQMGDIDIYILRKGKVYTRYFGIDEFEIPHRDYFQEGEVLSYEGRLFTTNTISPGKLVNITINSLQEVSITQPLLSLSRFNKSTLYYTRLNCGASKTRTSSKYCNSRMIVNWNESFTFRVPRAVTSLQLTIHNDKKIEV